MLPLGVIVVTLVALSATSAWAATAEGRWACIAYGATPAVDPKAPPPAPAADAPMDPTTGKPMLIPTGTPPDVPHGLLTIYANSYTYASAIPGDPASGSGDADEQNGLVIFSDGGLVNGAKVGMGKLETDASGGIALDLIGETGPVYTCTAP